MPRFRIKVSMEGRGFEPILLKRDGIEAEHVGEINWDDEEGLPKVNPKEVDHLKIEIRKTG